MFYPLKFQHNAESKVFFFSDFHYNHSPSWEVPLWKARGFNSVHEHNAGLIGRWNAKITNKDVVFHLGDIVFGKDGEQSLDFLLKTLNYKELFLLPGNHHSGYKAHYQRAFEINRIEKDCTLRYDINEEKTVYFIPNYFELFVNSQPVIVSHYPLKCWNSHAHGSIVCVGHTHGSYYDSLPTTLDKGKILDVGPEAVGEPLDFQEVMAIMNKKSILNESHHTKETQTPFC